MRPSELGLPGARSRTSANEAGKAKGKGKATAPMVVLSPEELDKLAKAGAAAKGIINGRATTEQGEESEEGEHDDDDGGGAEEEEPALWEDVANAVLWTVPFGFLFSGM